MQATESVSICSQNNFCDVIKQLAAKLTDTKGYILIVCVIWFRSEMELITPIALVRNYGKLLGHFSPFTGFHCD